MVQATKLKPWRGYPSANCVHGMRVHINMAAPDSTRGQVALVPGKLYHLGTLPPGAFVLQGSKHVMTAFGAGITIDVGTETVPNGFMTSAGIAPNAIGFGSQIIGALMGFVATETPVYVKLVGATAVGEADLVLPFYINKD